MAADLIGKFLKTVFGSRNDRILKTMIPIVEGVNALESELEALSDSKLRGKTDEFRRRLGDGETLDDLLVEAFAVMREAAKRVLGQRHFDVQLIGGLALHRGMIAEMVTGEGKTLVSTLPAYLNGLTGKGVHIVTVNDYLARRDRHWIGPIHEMLGLKVGVIQSEMGPRERIEEYAADITYGTNNEFGFDYLRDNMKMSVETQAQGRLHFAIVDEVDSILVDEARTPLIISGPAEESTDKYYQADRVVRQLRRKPEHLPDELPEEHAIDWDFEIKEKEHQATLTERGIVKAQRLLGVEDFFTGRNMDWPHHLEQSLKAHSLYRRDKEYVVKEGEVIIVDEFTGRLMAGRRWSDGLHQAVEAKENLRIREENQTLATITFQNFFRLYDKISGMTGTALTEAGEFHKIYGLDVLVIPTNKPLIRLSEPDRIYRTEKEKYLAVLDEIIQVHRSGRPILVGTTSIEKSELLSGLLDKRGVPHEVLNAKQHEREAQIVAKAGHSGNVTIATNMAGRGTDILLGDGVADIGGLHIVGTERHEARRIDNQLRGRAGRQGDPGSSSFFLSLEDDLMRIFARDWVKTVLGKLGMEEGQEIQSKMVSRMISRVQRKMEEHNFEIRKNLLEYDEVMDRQRKVVYSNRQEILQRTRLRDRVHEYLEDVVESMVEQHLVRPAEGEEPSLPGLLDAFRYKFDIALGVAEVEGLSNDELVQKLLEVVRRAYAEREKVLGEEQMRRLEGFLLLSAFDTKWKDHLYAMDSLRSGIGLRAYAQEDPKNAYRMEGSAMFQQMIAAIQDEVTDFIFKVRLREEDEEELAGIWEESEAVHEEYDATRAQMEAGIAGSQTGEKPKPIVRDQPKVGRNDPCPCGSGKKFKKCCLQKGPG
ncbi:MAG: preprotein translocase subunit SecA [Planctomycetota bacterium]|jgi:preprotein translocase subunit SecA